MDNSSARSARTAERGVILPLAAIIAGTILFILVALGIDTGLAKVVRAKAQQEVEEICRSGAEGLPVTRTAVGNIVARFNHLRAPLPGGKGGIAWANIIGFRIIAPTPPLNEQVTGPLPTRPGAPSPAGIAALTLSCPLDGGGTCLFGGDATATSVASEYPSQFWNPQVPTPLTQTSVQNNYVYGDIIACEMRLRVRGFLNRNLEVNVKTAYDRTQRGALFPPNSTSIPPASARSQRGGGLIIGISTHMTTDRSSPRFQFKTSPASRYLPLRNFDALRSGPPLIAFSGQRGASDFTTRFSPNAALSGPNQRERMVACMNLPVLVRNALLTRLVGWTTRDSLRDRTEIVHMGTQPFTGGVGNPPTIMFRGWEDTANNTLAGNGHIPFITYPGLVPNASDSASAVAGALRDCEHMYDNQARNFRRYTDARVVNNFFEPPQLSVYSQDQAVYFDGNYNPLLTGPGIGTWGRPANKPFANAEQVMSILGSTQSCPHAGICGKPSMITDVNQPPEDLRPDVISFMQYVRGVPGAQARPAPGLGPLGVPLPSQTVFSTDASILVVLHRRLTAPEATAVRGLLPANVAVTVIYIPVNQYDAAEEALVRLRFAFNAQQPLSATVTGNVLYVLAPPDCPPFTTCATATQLQWDNHFQEYWMELLNSANPNNIEQIGQTIYDRLKYVRLRL